MTCSIATTWISSSDRYGESRQVYREVQECHQDIQRIEVTLAELAQLFNDVRSICIRSVPRADVWMQMAVLLSQQDEQITSIETEAVGVEEDTRKGWVGGVHC